LDYVKQCEADIVNMTIMQRSSSGYEPTADKLYDQPLLGFVRTKNTIPEKEQGQPAGNNIVEVEEDESESCSSSDEDDSWHEDDPKVGWAGAPLIKINFLTIFKICFMFPGNDLHWRFYYVDCQ
jgi:RIO kinase 1